MRKLTATFVCFLRCIVVVIGILFALVLWLRIKEIHIQKLSYGSQVAVQNGQLIEESGRHALQMCNEKNVQKTHEALSTSTIMNSVLINRRHKLLYCAMPKIGSSFWKRVFKVMDESNSQNVHLYDMTGMSAHSDIPDSITLKNVGDEEMNTILKTFTQFTFARDPFSRLFSAYVDKIWVPTSVGFNVVQKFRTLNLTNASHLPCNWDISFGEFCALLADALLMDQIKDVHFLQMVNSCHPCKFNFTYIGKMENFISDTKYILHKANLRLGEITGGVDDLDRAHDLSTINDVTFRVANYYKESKLSCLSEWDIIHRLWSHFQIRGMISKRIPLPKRMLQGEGEMPSVKEFLTAAAEAYDMSGSKEDRWNQREEALLEAYSSVSRETLDKLAKLWAEDCSLFGYSCQIDKYLNRDIPKFYFQRY